MYVFLRLAIVVGVVFSGLPHAFCACGCMPATVEKSHSSGHSCCDSSGEKAPEGPEPCKCRTCDVAKAVPPAPAARASSLKLSSCCVPTAMTPSVHLVVCHHPERIGGLGPRQALPPPPCALPILLEHLLF